MDPGIKELYELLEYPSHLPYDTYEIEERIQRIMDSDGRNDLKKLACKFIEGGVYHPYIEDFLLELRKHLRSDEFENKRITSADIARIPFSHLEKISFTKCEFLDDSFDKLVENLVESRITDVSITRCALNNDQIEYLTSALTHYPIESLTLYQNNIGDQGIIALTLAFAYHKTLKNLRIGNNPFGRRGKHAIFTMLRTNQSIEMIDIYGNNITFDDVNDFQHALRFNRSLRFFSTIPEWQNSFNQMMKSHLAKLRLHSFATLGNESYDDMWKPGERQNDAINEVEALQEISKRMKRSLY